MDKRGNLKQKVVPGLIMCLGMHYEHRHPLQTTSIHTDNKRKMAGITEIIFLFAHSVVTRTLFLETAFFIAIFCF